MMKEDLGKLSIDKAGREGRTVRRRRSRWPMALLALILVAAGAAWAILPLSRVVKTAAVSRVYPAQTYTLLNASGYVVAQRKAAVASKTTGRLVWIGVEEGSRVKEGQIVARLEGEDVSAQRLQAEAAVRTAQATLERMRAELVDARANFRRMEDLFRRNFVSKSDYDLAKARLDKAEADVAAQKAQIEQARANLQAAEVAVEYTLIRTPFDAVVLTKNADIGDIITPLGAAANAKAAVVNIADMSSLLVEADVSESNLAKVGSGQPTVIQLDAIPDERFPGRVHMIVPTADRSKASVLVKVSFERLDPRVLPEMSAKVAFLEHPLAEGDLRARTVVNPVAVVERGEGKAVFLTEGGRAVLRPVRLGERVGDAVEVLEGLKPGDKVILDPPADLNAGDKVKVAEE